MTDSRLSLDRLYKYLYNRSVIGRDQSTRLKWEGDSLDVVRSWDKGAKENIGGDLDRVEHHEPPLDSRYVGDGIYELRDRQKNVWYRLMYWRNQGWVYVLHCFTKKTNQTSSSDLNLAKTRKKAVLRRKDAPYTAPPKAEGEKESA